MKKISIIALLCLLAITVYPQEKRLALVIGNSDYQFGGSLDNPMNDATDIELLLKASGFDVQKYVDLDISNMKSVIDAFGNRLLNAEVGLFFYAGHGIQARGRNYLIPVDANLQTENDVEYNCVDAGRILAKMEDAGTKTNIVILDACRDNPFERSWSRKSTGAGLAFMDAPNGSIIAYSTAPGKTASDGYERNSPYTSALIQYMDIQNLKIEDFFKLVRVNVREQTKGRQVPWESTSLEGDFYFKLDPDNVSTDVSVEDIEPGIGERLANNPEASRDEVFNYEGNRIKLARSIRSIVILPFANYTGDEGQVYLASGIHDALISELGQLGTIRVVSQTSTLFYAGFDKTIKEIANELNVEGVIEASLISIDETIRIQLKLFSIFPEEQLLWTQTFDSELSDMMNLYSEVIKNIANEIQISLSPEKVQQLDKPRKVNPEAYKAYLKGRFQMGLLTQEGIQSALSYYNRAIEIDPEYAPAYAGIGGVWMFLKQMDFISPDEANPLMEKYMSKALELDRQDEDVLFINAGKRVWTNFDWEGGEEYFKECLEINPYNSEAWAYYSHLLMILKRPDEMRETMRKALEVDPNNFLIQALEGIELMVESKYDVCINKMLQLQLFMPTNPLVILALFQCYSETGQYDLAIDEISKLFDHMEDESVIQTLKKEYSKSGFEKALDAVACILEESTGFISSQQMTTLYAYAGNSDKAMYWLEKMYIRGDPDIPYIGVIPVFRKYATNPRYIEIMQRMNLPLGKFE